MQEVLFLEKDQLKMPVAFKKRTTARLPGSYEELNFF